MPKRIFFGTLLVLSLIGTVLADRAIAYPVLAALVLAAITIQAQRELLTIMRPQATGLILPLGLATMMVFGWEIYADINQLNSAEGLPYVLVFALLLFASRCVWHLEKQRAQDQSDYGNDLAAATLGLIYLALPMSMLFSYALSFEGGEGTLLGVTLVLVAKCADIGGYLGGTLFGKHRVLPNVSPKKSYEGSACGWVLTIAAAYGAQMGVAGFAEGLGLFALIVFATVLNLANQLGDFAESMLKRSFGVKDSAALLPTFGGAFDIIDSLVFAIPVGLLALHWLSP